MPGGGAPDPAVRRPLNPNWAELQKRIASSGLRRTPNRSPPPTLLGKRKERPETGTDALEPSPPSVVLAPTSDDCSVTDLLAMDCEMVGVGVGGKRSALGRVTLVNAWGNVVYDVFVRPIERVVDHRTAISGIRPWNLKRGKDFPAVQKKVADLLKGRILVGHALHNDLKALLLSHPKKDIRDTSEYDLLMRKGKRTSLQHLAAAILGAKIQQKEHCSIEDARAVMMIYQKHKRKWEKDIKRTLGLKSKHRKQAHKKKQIASDSFEPNGSSTTS